MLSNVFVCSDVARWGRCRVVEVQLCSYTDTHAVSTTNGSLKDSNGLKKKKTVKDVIKQTCESAAAVVQWLITPVCMQKVQGLSPGPTSYLC